MGLNYSMTGVFYNKDLAAQIGMTEPPKTVAEFEDAAREGQGGGPAADHGVGRVDERRRAGVPAAEPDGRLRPDRADQRLDLPEAGRDHRHAVQPEAAQHLEQWIKNGYFPTDVNAIEYTDANGRFGKGEGVFMFNGDWQNAGYDTDLPGKVGFFAVPAGEAGGTLGGHVGAADLRHRRERQERRLRRVLPQLGRDQRRRRARSTSTVGGSNPGGPTDLPIPPAAEGSVTNETLAAGPDVAPDNGAMDFIANATGSIFAQGWTPELQKMVGGKQTADGLLKAVQAEYETELASERLERSRIDDWRGRSAESRPRSDCPRSRRPADLPSSGGPPAGHRRLAVRAAGARDVRRLRPAAAGDDRPVLALRWNGVGPVDVGRLDNYVKVLSDPELSESILNAFKLIVFFSFIPVGLGLVVASVIRRVATGRLGDRVAHGAVPAPGHPARRRRHRVELGAVHSRASVNQILSAVGLGGITARGSATSTGRCPRSGSSAPGCCSASARCCCSRA